MNYFDIYLELYKNEDEVEYFALDDIIEKHSINDLKYALNEISKYLVPITDFNYHFGNGYNLLDRACRWRKYEIVDYLLSHSYCDLDKTYNPVYSYMYVDNRIDIRLIEILCNYDKGLKTLRNEDNNFVLDEHPSLFEKAFRKEKLEKIKEIIKYQK